MDEMRSAFESYIVNRPLCKKYGAKLTRGINGEFYKDVRVEGHWHTWKSCWMSIKSQSGETHET